LILGSSLPKPGVYFINKIKSGNFDSYYAGDIKIPDPTVRLAYLGE